MKDYERKLWDKANRAAKLLQLVPYVRFVAVTGSLARGEAKPDSDADLFVVTAPKHLYTARAFALSILKFTGQRVNIEAGKISGAVDPNYWLTSDNLDLQPHTAFVARDYTYMRPVWGVSGFYDRVKQKNGWVKAYRRDFRAISPPGPSNHLRLIQALLEAICLLFDGWLERWARLVQEKRVRAFAARQGAADRPVLTDSEMRLHL